MYADLAYIQIIGTEETDMATDDDEEEDAYEAQPSTSERRRERAADKRRAREEESLEKFRRSTQRKLDFMKGRSAG